MKTIAWLAMVGVLLGTIIFIGWRAREAQQRALVATFQRTTTSGSVVFRNPPTLIPGESTPIIERALQRIKHRLAQAKDHIPALSEIDKSEITGGELVYKKGCENRDNEKSPPDACSLRILPSYGDFRDLSVCAQIPREYDLDGDRFYYFVFLNTPSGHPEIFGIIDQEMDMAAQELLKAGRHKKSFWPFW